MLPLLVTLFVSAEVSLPEKVVAFAESKLGQRVGDGQCTSLAVEALRHAGVRPPRGRGASWGEEVEALRDVKPGDILQFENAVFVRRRALENGGLLTSTQTFPHHTAIVARVRKRGPRPILVILHQNVGGADADDADRKVVQQATLNFAEKRGGTIKVYRPSGEPAEEPRPGPSRGERGSDPSPSRDEVPRGGG